MEPAKSFADWTILVKSSSGSEFYHVHRNMLLSCEVFSKSVHQLPPGGNSTLKLPDEAAQFFPDFLDYNYRIPVEIHSGNAVPLYSLSRTMGFSRLCWETRKFWEEDMSLENMDYYYRSALIYEEEKLMIAVKDACLEDNVLLGITEESPILSVCSPDLLQYMVKNVGQEYGKHLSKLVASFCAKQGVDAAVFKQLTASLGTVDFAVAPALLTAASKFQSNGSVITPFQRICIEALAHHWDEVDVDSPSFSAMLACQSPEFIAELYKQSIVQALADSGGQCASKTGSESRDDDGDYAGDEDYGDEQRAASSSTNTVTALPMVVSAKCSIASQAAE